MGESTKISWCDATFNPWVGCQKIAAGCQNCYAERETRPRVLRAGGIETWGPKGHRVVTSDAYWRQPRKWNREAEKAGVRRRVFCGSMCDVFEERPELLNWRCELIALIRRTPWLDWLLLTKRPENADRLWEQAATDYGDLSLIHWPENVWLGTSASTQAELDEAVMHLRRVPAAVRFLSLEPLLEELNFRRCNAHSIRCAGYRGASTPNDLATCDCNLPRINWVIVGGESGPHARLCESGWIRSIVHQSQAVSVPCFVKQWGSCPIIRGSALLADRSTRSLTLISEGSEPGVNDLYRVQLRDPKGGDINEFPEDLKVREIPNV